MFTKKILTEFTYFLKIRYYSSKNSGIIGHHWPAYKVKFKVAQMPTLCIVKLCLIFAKFNVMMKFNQTVT